MSFTASQSEASTIEQMAKPKKPISPKPTKMGERIMAFMTAHQISNRSQFAEGVLGISRQTFHAWLFKPMDAGRIAAKPILLCAQALGTNADFLLCMTDDPRAETSLTHDEATLIDAYRALPHMDRDKLLAIAADWIARSPNGGHSVASPFSVSTPTNKS